MIQLATQASSRPGSHAAAWAGGVRGPIRVPGSPRPRRGGHAWPFLSRQHPRASGLDEPPSATSVPGGSAGAVR